MGYTGVPYPTDCCCSSEDLAKAKGTVLLTSNTIGVQPRSPSAWESASTLTSASEPWTTNTTGESEQISENRKGPSVVNLPPMLPLESRRNQDEPRDGGPSVSAGPGLPFLPVDALLHTPLEQGSCDMCYEFTDVEEDPDAKGLFYCECCREALRCNRGAAMMIRRPVPQLMDVSASSLLLRRHCGPSFTRPSSARSTPGCAVRV